jgi:hypothetical protein
MYQYGLYRVMCKNVGVFEVADMLAYDILIAFEKAKRILQVAWAQRRSQNN